MWGNQYILSLMSTCKQKRDHGQVLQSSHLSLYKIKASACLKAFIPSWNSTSVQLHTLSKMTTTEQSQPGSIWGLRINKAMGKIKQNETEDMYFFPSQKVNSLRLKCLDLHCTTSIFFLLLLTMYSKYRTISQNFPKTKGNYHFAMTDKKYGL